MIDPVVRIRNAAHLAATFALTLALPGAATAQGEADAELQKKLANPVADIVTLPFQWTSNFGVGPYDKPQHSLNIQPVFPVKLGGGWSLIHRLIVPLESVPALMPGQDRVYGLGDINYQGFFSPAPSPSGLIWGLGPSLVMRTSSNERLGQGQWSLGPALVVLQEAGQLSAGALITQVWSFAGDSDRRGVNAFSLQPIVSWRLDSRNSIGYLGTITADWKEDRASQRWTVPLGISFSRLVKPEGFVPMNLVAGAGYNVVRPDLAARWFLRLQVNFILPK